MERRVRGNSHARCEAGENSEITSKSYLSLYGITASAIMAIGLNHIGIKPKVRLPRRISEGFGLSEKIVDEIDEGIVITVDNGIAAVDPIQKAKDKGLTVIVTDHHLPNADGVLPNADYIINPHLPGTADFAEYCGAGIAYKLCCEFVKDERIRAIMSGYAAIGTIADVTPILHDNRNIVNEGLKNLLNRETRTTGMGALLNSCYLNDHISPTDVGFRIGPALNAPGRLYDDGAMIALKTIVYNGNYGNARKLADNLVNINETRKELAADTMEEAYYNISTNCLHGDSFLSVYLPGTPEGLTGIIAGRLAENMQSPCIVFTDSQEKGVLKGSGRSYGGIDLKGLLDENQDLLLKYGGHTGAAGVSISKENLNELRSKLIESVDALPEIEIDDTVYYDLEIDASEVPKMIAEQKKYEPFGHGNPKPIFKIKNFELTSPRHSGFYTLKGADKNTITMHGQHAQATGFGLASEYLDLNKPMCLDFIGTIGENHFRGNITPEVELAAMKDSQKTMEQTSLAKLLAKTAQER